MSAGSVGRSDGCWTFRKEHCLYQHWDDSTSGQAEWLVAEYAQYAANLAGVGRYRNPGMVICTEDLIQYHFGSRILLSACSMSAGVFKQQRWTTHLSLR